MSHARPASAARRRLLPAVDYGWVIVAALCITETITWGIIHYGFPVFLRAMEGDLCCRARRAPARR
ncbi:MAG: hypothetical protein Q8Q58_05450 [Candidatus Rokubacteria bacterium]|nr:hypothetical protein [Candidatus Rokubacteria bacterium]